MPDFVAKHHWSSEASIDLPREDFIHLVKSAPLVSLDFIVRNPMNNYLLGRRKNSPARNSWFVVGGRIRRFERREEAMTRILWEELRLNYARLKSEGKVHFRYVTEHMYPDENAVEEPGVGTHYVVLVYEVEAEPSLSDLPTDQHSEYKWFTAEELIRSPEVHEYTKDYLRTLRLLPVPGLYQSLMAHYLHYEGQMWSRTQLLLAVEGAALVASFRYPPAQYAPFVMVIASVLVLFIWRLIERDRQNRDVNVSVMDELARGMLGDREGPRRLNLRASVRVKAMRGTNILRFVFLSLCILNLVIAWMYWRRPELIAWFFSPIR